MLHDSAFAKAHRSSVPYLAFILTVLCCLYTVLAKAQAPNDTRATASQLTVGAPERCNPTKGNISDAFASLAEPPCAPLDARGTRRDLWYYFVTTAASTTIVLDVIGGSPGTLYFNATLTDGTALQCRTVNAWAAVRLYFDDRAVGDTVYIQLAGLDPYAYTTFNICAFETPPCLPPTNINMTVGQNWTQLYFQNADGSSASVGGRRYRALAGPAGYRPAFGKPDTTAVGGRQPLTVWGLTPGEFYYIYLQEQCSLTEQSVALRPSQNFRQKPAGSPPGDSLRGVLRDSGRPQTLATELTGCFPTPGTTRSATAEAGLPAGCGGEADDDVWYSIKPAGTQYRVILTPAPGISTDLVLEVRDADLKLIDCINEAPGGTSEVYNKYDFTPGAQYYFRVYTAEAGAVADYEICIIATDRPILTDTGCTDALRFTIDGTGAKGDFVDVLTPAGEIVVSIENTINLGAVKVSYFGARDSVRVLATDSVPVYYGRSNITIEPERQPNEGDSVTVRFYISGGDLIGLAQVGAVQGLGPNIEAIPDRIPPSNSGSSGGGGTSTRSGSRGGRLTLYLPADSVDLVAVRVPQERCSADYLKAGFATSVVGRGEYADGLYLDVRVPGFSEFFFSSGNTPLSREIASGLSPKPAVRALSMYPNPTTGRVTVVLPEGIYASELRYDLVDAMGRVVDSGSAFSVGDRLNLTFEGLPTGMYSLLLVGDNDTYAGRILLE